jgi:hypothetical protein
MLGLIVLAGALPANATVTGIGPCSDTQFTINVAGFPDAQIVVQLLLQPSGEIILDTTYNFAAQTITAVRPAGLPGGTYRINVYVNGVWFLFADINICDLGTGGGGGGGGTVAGGRTPGFWANKNGQKLITSADLQALSGFCLRSSSGADFNPATKASLATWLRSSTARNMANKLSVQLTATYLSVQHGFTDPNAVVDGSLTVNGLIQYANSLLCADGNTPSGDANRAEQERVKDILDKINNGQL